MEKYFDINEKGHSIRCKMFVNNARDINQVVVCGHGFAGHKDNKSTERFSEAVLSKYKDVAVISFDWPAHGKDVKKKLLLSDCDVYLDIVLEYIRAGLGIKDIKGYSNSFGAYVFMKYIYEHGNPFTKLVLRSPAVNIYDSMMNNIMKKQDLEIIDKGKTAEVGFDRKIGVGRDFLDEVAAFDIREKEYIEEFEKIMVFHGTADEIIPYEQAKKFADDNLFEFVAIDNGDHRIQNYAAMGNVIKKTIEFLELK